MHRKVYNAYGTIVVLIIIDYDLCEFAEKKNHVGGRREIEIQKGGRPHGE